MEDINEKLEQLLQDPGLEDKLAQALHSLGVGESNGTEDKAPSGTEPGGMDMGALASMLGGSGADMAGLMGLLSGGEDSGSRLLTALSPYLRPSRRKKVEEAKRLMTMTRLLPLLTGGKEKERETSDRG